jgi:hypothetical protein
MWSDSRVAPRETHGQCVKWKDVVVRGNLGVTPEAQRFRAWSK